MPLKLNKLQGNYLFFLNLLRNFSLNERTVPKIAELLSPMIAEINETEARDAHKKPHIPALDCNIHSDKFVFSD